MRKILLIIFFSINISAFAQVYISAGAGYAWPRGASKQTEYNASVQYTLASGKVTDFSCASGMNYNIATGYMFRNNLGVELDMNMILGKAYTNTEVYLNSPPEYYKYVTTSKVPTSVFITPSIVFKNNTLKRISTYCRAGLMILGYGKQYNSYSWLNNASNSTDKSLYMTYETNNRLTFGFSSALGFNFSINKHFNIGIEFNTQNINPFVKNSVKTSYIINGKETISSLATYSKETVYLKQSNELGGTNSNGQFKMLAYSNNYSNMGYMIRVKYSFNKKN